MEKLALLGGEAIASGIQIPAWPPTDDATAQLLTEIYRSGNWSFGGPHEKKFAADFAAAHDASFGVFMANGTVTLQCALGVHGIGAQSGGDAGDEVIMPSLTWPATAMAALYVGAVPVFADIEATTLCLDPAAFEAAITPRTRAVIPVHIYGGMADLEEIQKIADKHNIVVIEDCAHAQGGKWNDQGLGSWGAVGSFSFQQSKTMASGEGGICLTNDEELADKLYRMKHIGYGDGSRQGVYSSGPPAGLMVHNFRATEFQAAILQGQLANLDALMEIYNRNAARLEDRLRDVAGVRVQSRGRLSSRQSYYAFTVVWDEEPLADVSLPLIHEALGAEGFSMGGTYGVVYQHILFNVAKDKYRVEPSPVAEKIGAGRTSVALHMVLGADDKSIELIGEAIAKVAGNTDALRAHANHLAQNTTSEIVPE